MSRIIPVEGLTPRSMKQVYERVDLGKHMYTFLLNNCRRLAYKRFRITNLELKLSVNLSVGGTLQVISLERKPGADGIAMYYFNGQDGESLYGVENEDLNFEMMVSRSIEKRVVYELNLEPGTTADTVSFETQKYYDYGNESIPQFYVVCDDKNSN